jgi:spore germination protein YaaH
MTAMITGPLVASAQSKTENIFYYFPNIKGYQSLEKNYRDIDILAPQIYTVGYDLKLGKAQSEDVLKFAKKKRMDVMPLVIQSGFDKALMTGILNDHNAQDQIIKDLIDEAKKGIYRLAI